MQNLSDAVLSNVAAEVSDGYPAMSDVLWKLYVDPLSLPISSFNHSLSNLEITDNYLGL